jgi:hypothetical protein
MTKTNLSRLPNEYPTRTLTQRVAGGIGVAILLLMTGIACAQGPTPAAASSATVPQAPQPAIQNGFVLHETVDLGGHVVGIYGSGSMYDTLVNIQSGPRVLGETFTLHAVPGSKHAMLDSLSAFSSGFGGDPNNFAKLDFSKGKLYEFAGTFRRDRQYFDYDLLGNPDIPTVSMPYGEVGGKPTTASVPWSQINDSSVMFNTVRRMTDTSLTLFPLSKVTLRVAYSQKIFQGPSLSPGESVGKYNSLLEEYQRNSTDDFIGGIDWKPAQQTKFTFEEEVDHYKADSYFTLAPSDFIAQEADGTPVSLGDWDSPTPYGIAGCNTASMGSAYTNSTNYTIFTAPQTPGGLPVINPACDVVTSYLRSQPTRSLYPTEIFRFQSSSIKNLAMNGDVRFTKATTNLPNYYENFQGLDGAIRNATFTGNASAKRQDVAIDYGITWQATNTFSLSDQVEFDNVHQPGTSTIYETNQNTPTTAVAGNNGYETINYAGTLTPVTNGITAEGSSSGTPLPDYFGQKSLTNNATASWDATDRATFALTYRYRVHVIGQGIPDNAPLAVAADTNGTVTIHENGGIFNVALRPTDRWTVSGTAEVLYDDNAYTPIGPRQTNIYRVHSIYRPRTWATVSGAYLDTEHHNNTYNNQAATAEYAQTSTTATVSGVPYDGPLDHVDHSRKASISADLSPNEHYGFDFTYGYSDVYTSTNICYLSGASATMPGVASVTSSGANNLCPFNYARGGSRYAGSALALWGPVKDFTDAPTQYASFSLALSPIKSIQSSIGYNISAVSGNQFFNDAQGVNGSLQSAYQSPFVHVAWTVHPGWVWKADYNYYGYGEGGPSGAPFCSNSTSTTAAVLPCASAVPTGTPSATTLVGPTGMTEPSSGLTAPRNFHANVLTISMHYEF